MNFKVFFLLVIMVSILAEAKRDENVKETKRKCKPKDHESRKYTKEANVNFDEKLEDDCVEEDEIINDEEDLQGKQDDKKSNRKVESKPSKEEVIIEKGVETPTIPEDILPGGFSVDSMFQELFDTIGNGYDEAFNAALKILAEIEINMKNLATEVTRKVDKLSKEKDKDLSKVNEIVKSIVKNTSKDFKTYSETITENQVMVSKSIKKVFSKKTTVSSASNKILTGTQDKFGRLQEIANEATVFINSVPNKIDEITSKANENIKNELTKLEKQLDVELGDIITYIDENINNYNTELAKSIRNTTAGLSETLTTFVTVFGLIGQLF